MAGFSSLGTCAEDYELFIILVIAKIATLGSTFYNDRACRM